MEKKMNKKPNIILILSDDLGYEVIGSNGGTSYKTPILDQLAKTGIRFENAHVQPLCTPSRIAVGTISCIASERSHNCISIDCNILDDIRLFSKSIFGI